MDAPEALPRFVEKSVREAMSDTPVIVIQGARQVGKSTLAAMLANRVPGSQQMTLDDPTTLAIAQADPDFFLAQAGESLLVIDEAQRAPELILPLKAAVDRDRRPGRFLLTGSADLLQVKGTGDSLAGRAETIELKPLSQGELNLRESPEDFVHWVTSQPDTGDRFDKLAPETLVAGGYPEASRRSPARRARWFESYIQRLSSHDARELSSGAYADHLQVLLRLLAAGGQQELVVAKMARAMSLAESTIDSYLRLAHAMRLVSELPSWGRSYRSRITRRRKVGLLDPGLAASLIGFTAGDAQSLGGREYYGTLVELFVALELEKQSGWSQMAYKLHHFRDLDGLEVDIVVEIPGGPLLAVEVKSSAMVTERSWANIRKFKESFPDREVLGVCLHAGTQVGRIEDWLYILPITALWQH